MKNSTLIIFFLRNSDKSVRQSDPSTNPWIIGGSIGSKDSILVFRTCALSKNELNEDTASTSPKQKPAVAGDNTDRHHHIDGNCGNVLEPQNHNITAKVKIRKKIDVFYEKGLKKRTHDSLSSSETSISSACDDPTEIEADILKASENLAQENADTTGATQSTRPPTVTSSQTDDLLTEPKVINETMDEKENMTDDQIDVCDMPAAILKITYKFTNTETKLLRRIVSSHGLKEAEESQSFSLLWTGVHIKPDILRNLTPYQRVNHFPR